MSSSRAMCCHDSRDSLWTDACVRGYELWLDSYMQALVTCWDENCPAGFQKV
jgi:hypothetical protein